jgi:hypothetical protein
MAAQIDYPASQACKSPATGRLLPSLPHSQSWTLSQEANKKCGTCSVCFATRQLHNKDGTDHKHGPRDNPCPGSHLLPLSHLGHTIQTMSPSQKVQPSLIHTPVVAHSDCGLIPSSGDTMQHPVHCGPVLKRIPKNARVHASNLLLKLINDVLQHPSASVSWRRLLEFPSACLVKPARGGKSRNLTTGLIKLMQQYEEGFSQNPAASNKRVAPRCSAKTVEQQIASMAAAKLENGDVKGAVKLLCSDDQLAEADSKTRDELKGLHPSPPEDSRPIPTHSSSPLPSMSVSYQGRHSFIP